MQIRAKLLNTFLTLQEIRDEIERIQKLGKHRKYKSLFFKVIQKIQKVIQKIQERLIKHSKCKLFKPGERAPVSGQYRLIHKKGLGPERTIVKRKRFPPPPKSDMQYVLVDQTQTWC